MVENKRMCQRSGTYEELTAAGNSLLQDEMLVVESGDPNTTTGRGLYMSYPNSQRERLRFASEELSADDIAEGSITNDLLHDDSVDTNNIIDGSITPAKFASSVGFGSGYSFICSNTGEIVAYSTGTSTITAFQPSGYTVPANYYVWLDKGVNSISSSALTRDSSHVLSRIYAENENVDLSGLDTTGVTVTRGFNKKYKQFILSSLSLNAKTVDSILSDIATLNAKFPIVFGDLALSLRNTINGKFDFVDVSLQSSTIFDSTVVLGKIYHGTINGVEYLWWTVENSSSSNKTQYRWSVNGLEWRKKANGTWSDWTPAIADNSITYGMLSTTLQGIIDGKLPYERVVNVGDSPINLNTLNSRTFTPFKFYYLYKGTDIIPDLNTNEYTLFFPLTNLSQIIILANGDVYSRSRESTAAQWSDFKKTTADIERDIGSLSYNMAQAQAAVLRLTEDVDALTPSYSIGFASDGTVITRANTTDIGVGSGIGNSNVRSIYVASKATSISSSIISATIGLTTDTLDLYVDNTQGNIDIASEILSDSRITIHYKGSFSVIDLLANSQQKINEKIVNSIGDESFIIDETKTFRKVVNYASNACNVNIPAFGVKKIIASCFSYDTNITALNLYGRTGYANELEEIERMAFYSCPNLMTVYFTYPCIRYIREHAFKNCTNLQQMPLSGVYVIERYAFQNCGFTTVALPGTLTDMGEAVFSECQNLTTVTYDSFGTSINSIGALAFYLCRNLTNLSLPPTLTEIQRWAFGTTNIDTLTLPSGLTTIGDYAFYGCKNLATLSIPNNLTTLGLVVFGDCNNLENVTVENGFNCNNLNLSSSTKYSASTIVSWLNALADRTGDTAYTLTIGSTNLNKLTTDQIAIATNKNWNLA